MESGDYLKELKERSKKSRAYTKHQLLGLEISQLLGDEKHKALYIKLAKNNDPDELRRVAKDVSERKNIENKGAYFMKVWALNHSRKNAGNRITKR